MPGLSNPRYRGIYPVVPTTFNEDGTLDLPSQKRCIDFMIDSGVDGLCILATYSEQFLLGDDERETLTRLTLEHVAGRVPVIVTTTHTSTAICAARSRRAQDMGAAMVMVMPPYHGATFRFGEPAVYRFFADLSDAISIPVMIQDAPAAGTAGCARGAAVWRCQRARSRNRSCTRTSSDSTRRANVTRRERPGMAFSSASRSSRAHSSWVSLAIKAARWRITSLCSLSISWA